MSDRAVIIVKLLIVEVWMLIVGFLVFGLIESWTHAFYLDRMLMVWMLGINLVLFVYLWKQRKATDGS